MSGKTSLQSFHWHINFPKIAVCQILQSMLIIFLPMYLTGDSFTKSILAFENLMRSIFCEIKISNCELRLLKCSKLYPQRVISPDGEGYKVPFE